jgi:glycosyltransferase involved in cell wall biosynthesis
VSWGGLEINQLKNASWMKERGHLVLMLALENSPIFRESINQELSVRAIEKHRRYYDFSAGRSLAKILDHEEITHLIIRDNRDLSTAVIAKRKSRSKIHLSYFMEMQLGVSKKGIFHSIRYRYLDLWSCPLNWLKEQVLHMTKIQPDKVKVIPSGVEMKYFNTSIDRVEARRILELPPDKFIFGLIGRFDEYKGQLLVLEAFSKISNRNCCVCFLGEPNKESDGSYLKKMNEFVIQNNLKNSVFIRPFRKDVATFYHALDVCLMASASETVGMVTIESMACGIPVIASNAGGSIEILGNGNNGLLFESMNAMDLALKMEAIMSGDEKFNTQSLRQVVQQFDHNSVCEQVENVLGLV